MKKTAWLYVLAFMVPLGLHGLQAAWADRDDRNWHDGREGWHQHAREAHEWHNRHWHDGRVIYERNEPYVTYAPPVVVPPPDYDYEAQPSVNFVVPLNIH
jgi:hypothetical protein